MDDQETQLEEGLTEGVRSLIHLDRALRCVGVPGLLERPHAEAEALVTHVRNAVQRREPGHISDTPGRHTTDGTFTRRWRLIKGGKLTPMRGRD